jgi:hypothetical protein
MFESESQTKCSIESCGKVKASQEKFLFLNFFTSTSFDVEVSCVVTLLYNYGN